MSCTARRGPQAHKTCRDRSRLGLKTPARTPTGAQHREKKKKKNRRHLTFNLVFGQVHRGAVREDVGDGADAPVHQRGGDWVHRHDCDLWQPPAPSSRTNVYREDANFPPRSPRQLGSESMDGGRGARRETARGSAAWPPICSLQDERAEGKLQVCEGASLTSL